MSILISRASEATVSFTTPQEVVINKNDDSIEVFQVNPDNLNANANLQVGNTDVSSANPIPIKTVGYSVASNTTPTINNISSVVLAANASRKNAYVFNQTGGVVFLKLGAAAVINEGIRLVNNSMYEINSSNLWLGSINAIKSGATGVALDIFEGT
jgi:hypothetical protein